MVSGSQNLLCCAAEGSFTEFGLEGLAIEHTIASAQRSIEAVYSGYRQTVRTRVQHENWFRSSFLVARGAILKASPRQQLGIVHSFLQVGSNPFEHIEAIVLGIHISQAISAMLNQAFCMRIRHLTLQRIRLAAELWSAPGQREVIHCPKDLLTDITTLLSFMWH